MSVLILVFLLFMVFLDSTSWAWTILIKEIFWLIGRFSSRSSGRYYSSGGSRLKLKSIIKARKTCYFSLFDKVFLI